MAFDNPASSSRKDCLLAQRFGVHILPVPSKRASVVAQIFSLLYRGFVIGGASLDGGARRVANPRYCRLKICATPSAGGLPECGGIFYAWIAVARSTLIKTPLHA